MAKLLFLASAICFAVVAPIHTANSGVLGTSIKASIWKYNENYGCKSQNPIAIVVSNRSFREVVRVTFELEIWLDGRTNSVLKDGAVKTFDKLVPAFSSQTLCFTDSLFREMWDASKSSPEPLTGRTAQGRNLFLESVERSRRYSSWYDPFVSSAKLNVTILKVEKR